MLFWIDVRRQTVRELEGLISYVRANARFWLHLEGQTMVKMIVKQGVNRPIYIFRID